MHYSHAKNEGGWGKLNMRTTNLPGQALPKDDGIAITQPVLPSSIFHNTTHLDPEDKDTHNPNLEFVTKISKIDGTTMPSRITVETDDTWGGIAAKQTGRSEYGEIIAEKNGCPNVDTPPTAGTVITIPAEFIPTTNSANDIVAYRTIQQAIQGSLLPVLYFNPKAKKQSCEETIVLTAIAVTAGIVAAEVVGPAAFSLSGALGAALTAGMVDATLQGVALGAGLLHTFSAENFLVTTLSAGVGSYLGGAFSITVKSPLYQQMLLSMSEAAATDSIVQGAEIGLGLSKKFDLKQMMSSMASAAMTTVISHYDRLETGDMERALLEAIPDGFGSALIGSAIMGKKFDVRQTIAQTIGTVIGTVAGMELRDAIRAEREPYPWLQSGREAIVKGYADGIRAAYGDLGGAIPYLNPMQPWHSLDWNDLTGDAESGSNSPINSAESPSPKPDPQTSEQKPRSYTAMTSPNPLSPSGKRDLNLMIQRNQVTFLNQFDPDYYGWEQYNVSTQNPSGLQRTWNYTKQATPYTLAGGLTLGLALTAEFWGPAILAALGEGAIGEFVFGVGAEEGAGAIFGRTMGRAIGKITDAYSLARGINDLMRGGINENGGIFNNTNVDRTLAEAEEVTIPQNRESHIFRDAPGHIQDTTENRDLLVSVAKNPENTLGTDKFGNVWSAKLKPDGTQVWVQSRNGSITNGGINLTPKEFNDEMGLSQMRSPGYKP